MTDDIVTRLRELADAFEDDNIQHDLGTWVSSAADEIERLRKELTTEQTLVMFGQAKINHLQEWKQVANMFGECFLMDEFGQFPTSNDGDVLEAVKAWEQLRTKEAST